MTKVLNELSAWLEIQWASMDLPNPQLPNAANEAFGHGLNIVDMTLLMEELVNEVQRLRETSHPIND